MNHNKELTALLLEHMEKEEIHRERREEDNYYNIIASGDIEAVKPMASMPSDLHMYEREGYGRLSSDSVRNLRYHFVTSVALIARHCTEKGLPQEVAYTMSDMYINKMDKMNSLEEILRLHGEMIMDYTKHMASIPKQKIYSLRVIEVMNYVGKNLNTDLSVSSIAETLNMNRSYLSRLFLAETGTSLSDYIRHEKIKAGANLVRFSDYSYTLISEYLHFSSQSHFISSFKKEMGETPAEYRKRMANENPVY